MVSTYRPRPSQLVDPPRYLIESGEYESSLYVVSTALNICKKGTKWHAHLCNSAGIIACERAKAIEAKARYEECLKIRERVFPKNHTEIANIYNNFANSLICAGGSTEALEEAEALYLKCLEIDATKPEDETRRLKHIRHFNLGNVYTWLERYDDAVREILSAQQMVRENFGAATHWDAV
jgi:tetratricopeptide (TPR) repeat protein